VGADVVGRGRDRFRGIAGKEGYGATVELVRALARVTPGGSGRRRGGRAGRARAGRCTDRAAAAAHCGCGGRSCDRLRGGRGGVGPPRPHTGPRAARDAGQTDPCLLDQDGAPPKDITETRRRLSFTDRDGGYELSGWLDREAAEIVRSALSPLAAPGPVTDTEVDLRNSAQRDADALVELARRALGAGELPTEGSERP